MATSRKKVWLSLSMTQTVLSELDKVAEKEGRSRSMQARKFIEQMLQVYKAEEAEKARAARAALRGAS